MLATEYYCHYFLEGSNFGITHQYHFLETTKYNNSNVFFKVNVRMGRNMRKIGFFVWFVLLSMLLCFFEPVSAEMQKPEWQVGDFWEYEMAIFYPNSNFSAKGKLEIKEEKTITVNLTEYNVYEQIGSFNFTNMDLNYAFYYNKSNLAELKLVAYSSSPGVTYHVEYTYDPPLDYDWPLKVGDSWQVETTETVYDESNSSVFSEEITKNYECLRKTEVNIPAGSYNCYEVKSWNEKDDKSKEYLIEYYSTEVGNTVKQEQYSNDSLHVSMILTSYKYGSQSNDSSDEDFKIGFEFVFIVFIMLVVMFIFIWRHKKTK